MAFWRKKAILAKIETVYGTDSTPTGSANAMIATDFRITPIAGSTVSRNLEQPYMGAQEEQVVGEHVEVSFKVELAGVGAGAAGPDAPPLWGPLMRACGNAEVITADTSVAYHRVSEGFESVTIYTNIDGRQHKLLGARGNWTLSGASKEFAYLNFTLRGLLVAPTDTALPTVDTTDWAEPLKVSDANTDFTIAATARVLRSFSLDAGNQVVPRHLVGQEEIMITDGSANGQFVIPSVALSAYNPFAAAIARTKAAVVLTHGTVAQNIVTVTVPLAQPRQGIQIGQTDGVEEWTVPYLAIPSSDGNDDYSIVCT